MCIGLWTLEHRDYALIICSNRDEVFSRPTEDAKFHSFGHEPTADGGNATTDEQRKPILSGLDVRAGGTWFGLNRAGRIALLTNITEPPAGYAQSRGVLVSSFLESDKDEKEVVGQIQKNYRDAKFAGFNMLLLAPRGVSQSSQPQSQSQSQPQQVPPSSGSHSISSSTLAFDAYLVTNGGAGGPITTRALTEEERRCGGISNGVDGKGGNEWPKVVHGTRALKTLLDGRLSEQNVDEAEIADSLFEILKWRSPEPISERSDLRNTIHVEPISLKLSSSGAPDLYGTRLSTVLLIRRDGQVLFIERDVHTVGNDQVTSSKRDTPSERVFRFTLDTNQIHRSQTYA